MTETRAVTALHVMTTAMEAVTAVNARREKEMDAMRTATRTMTGRAVDLVKVGTFRAVLHGWWRVRRTAVRGDAGMSTTEYAMGTIAAAAFAAVLYKVLTSGAVTKALESVIGKALDAPF